ncbi:hypothetical protein EGH22_01350 [Halomicroarcula sp. F28]|uniref:hypothetical protein n=1 Tax=Haloarcula salinisoli TaxID=2487746 RepID=UPI001C739A19|nr:hypothetical protein [Halomicroarcula salinisoli]MBX0284960.1 hypothetical protein [Halomicroarcula salinisoli]
MSDDERDDPFENLEDPADREGDPFERLGDTGPDETEGESDAEQADGDSTPDAPAGTGGDSTTDADDEPAFEEEFIDEGDPFESGPGTTPSPSPAGGSGASEPVEDDPLGDDDPFAGMDGREGDPFGEGESAFESVDVESVDADEVWESLNEEPETATVEGTRYTDVSKHRFCEQCEFFSSPPNAHCTHEEAEIIEYLDMETVRLLNCPVVAEQRELEDEG